MYTWIHRTGVVFTDRQLGPYGVALRLIDSDYNCHCFSVRTWIYLTRTAHPSHEVSFIKLLTDSRVD